MAYYLAQAGIRWCHAPGCNANSVSEYVTAALLCLATRHRFTLAGKTIGVLGVTFKPNTDDMRDAPSLTIVPALVGAGATVRVTDPQGRREGEALLPGVTWVDDAYAAASDADAVRYIGTLQPGEDNCRHEYWLISYPQCVNVDPDGSSTYESQYPPCDASITGGIKPDDVLRALNGEKVESIEEKQADLTRKREQLEAAATNERREPL